MPKYPYRDLGVNFDRNFRNALNTNFDDIEADIKEVQNNLNEKDSAAHARMTQIENDSIERDNDLDARIDNIVANAGSSNTEIVDARYDSINNATYPTLKDRLDDTSNKIGILLNRADRVSVKEFGAKGDGVTDDYNAIMQAMNYAISQGKTLYFPTPSVSYLISQKITITQKVKFVGEKAPIYDGTRLVDGVVIEGQGIYITGGDGHYFENIGVQNPNNANGFQILGTVYNAEFVNCVSLARDHCYLFEGYEGAVEGVKAINCKSYNAIHGFISKSKYASFIDCEAYNHSSYGFGAISDNILGATKKALAFDNKIKGCKAFSCGVGFITYSRDMFSSTNANGISASGLTIENCSAILCDNSYVIGDSGTPPTGVAYNKVYNTNVIGCTQRGGVNSFLIGRVDGLSIDNVSIETAMVIDYSLANNVNVGTVNSLLTDRGAYSDIEQFTVNNIQPNVLSGRTIFKTANTAPTTITDIIGGKEDRMIIVMIDDNYTTINNGGKFALKRASFSKKGSWVVLKLQDNVWHEIIGYQVPNSISITQNLTTNPTLDLKQGSIFDLIGSGSTTNVVTITDDTNLQSEILTVIIRSTTGTFTYGGFDSSKFVVPTTLKTSVSFGTAYTTQWVYMSAINKWVCVNEYDTKYA